MRTDEEMEAIFRDTNEKTHDKIAYEQQTSAAALLKSVKYSTVFVCALFLLQYIFLHNYNFGMYSVLLGIYTPPMWIKAKEWNNRDLKTAAIVLTILLVISFILFVATLIKGRI